MQAKRNTSVDCILPNDCRCASFGLWLYGPRYFMLLLRPLISWFSTALFPASHHCHTQCSGFIPLDTPSSPETLKDPQHILPLGCVPVYFSHLGCSSPGSSLLQGPVGGTIWVRPRRMCKLSTGKERTGKSVPFRRNSMNRHTETGEHKTCRKPPNSSRYFLRARSPWNLVL